MRLHDIVTALALSPAFVPSYRCTYSNRFRFQKSAKSTLYLLTCVDLTPWYRIGTFALDQSDSQGSAWSLTISAVVIKHLSSISAVNEKKIASLIPDLADHRSLIFWRNMNLRWFNWEILITAFPNQSRCSVTIRCSDAIRDRIYLPEGRVRSVPIRIGCGFMLPERDMWAAYSLINSFVLLSIAYKPVYCPLKHGLIKAWLILIWLRSLSSLYQMDYGVSVHVCIGRRYLFIVSTQFPVRKHPIKFAYLFVSGAWRMHVTVAHTMF